MSLLVELAPRLRIEYINDESKRDVRLRSNCVRNILNKYQEKCSIYLAAGGNIGEEIVSILKHEGSMIKHIKIKDDAKIESFIRSGNQAATGQEKMHKLTFDDINSIRREFISALYNEDSVLLPIYDIEKDFALDFLRKVNDYHKSSVVFGDGAIFALQEKPTAIILTKDQVIDYAPFKIVSDYELINFSYSLTEGNNTNMLILNDHSLLFYYENMCLEYDCDKYDVDMIMFAFLFAIENNLPKKDWPYFVAAASQSEVGTKIGEILANSKKINMSVLRRWQN